MSRIGSRRHGGGAEEKARTAPMLYRIVHGTSATSLNLIRVAADIPRLFDRASLYEAIIFKYPNFGQGRPRAGGRGLALPGALCHGERLRLRLSDAHR